MECIQEMNATISQEPLAISVVVQYKTDLYMIVTVISCVYSVHCFIQLGYVEGLTEEKCLVHSVDGPRKTWIADCRSLGFY